jgi:hypothetical protein
VLPASAVRGRRSCQTILHRRPHPDLLLQSCHAVPLSPLAAALLTCALAPVGLGRTRLRASKDHATKVLAGDWSKVLACWSGKSDSGVPTTSQRGAIDVWVACDNCSHREQTSHCQIFRFSANKSFHAPRRGARSLLCSILRAEQGELAGRRLAYVRPSEARVDGPPKVSGAVGLPAKVVRTAYYVQ